MAIGPFGWTRTTTARLGRPAGNRYPTFALVRPLVSIVDTETEHGPVAFTGPGTPVGCQRSRSRELVGGKGFEPNRSLGRTGLRPVSGPSARTALSQTRPLPRSGAHCRASDPKTKKAF